MPIDPCIVADIGGTNARFGVAVGDDNGIRIEEQHQVKCADFPDFESAFSSYRDNVLNTKVHQACVAVAGPVTGQSVLMTNLDWQLSIPDLQRKFGLDVCEIVNDVAAVACAVPQLRDEDLVTVCEGTRSHGSPIAVIGPGTGLGVAALMPRDSVWVVVPSEGGHALISTTGRLESLVIERVGGASAVTAETLLSGNGILRIYNALCDIEGVERRCLTPEEATQAALRGSDEQAVAAHHMFCRLLGGMVGNIVLIYGALGGVYLSGGILPIMQDLLLASDFEDCLKSRGAMSRYLESLPVALITGADAGLIGAASWMANRLKPGGIYFDQLR